MGRGTVPSITSGRHADRPLSHSGIPDQGRARPCRRSVIYGTYGDSFVFTPEPCPIPGEGLTRARDIEDVGSVKQRAPATAYRGIRRRNNWRGVPKGAECDFDCDAMLCSISALPPGPLPARYRLRAASSAAGTARAARFGLSRTTLISKMQRPGISAHARSALRTREAAISSIAPGASRVQQRTEDITCQHPRAASTRFLRGARVAAAVGAPTVKGAIPGVRTATLPGVRAVPAVHRGPERLE